MADPTSVTGLLYRARAASLALSNGAGVSSWALDVGGLTFTQGSGVLQPSYLASGLNGRPAVRFSGGQGMPTSASMPGSSQPITLVMVYRPDDVASGQRNLIHLGSSEMLHDAGEQPQIYAGALLQATTAVSQTAGAVVTMTFSGASSAIHVNGTSSVTGDAGTGGLGNTAITIGWHPSVGGREFSGDIYEFLIYDHALTADERATVHSYVQDTYAITVSDYVSPGQLLLPIRIRQTP